MPDIVLKPASGGVGAKARGALGHYLLATYTVAMGTAAWFTVKFAERKAREAAAKRGSSVAVSAPATASNDPFPGAV